MTKEVDPRQLSAGTTLRAELLEDTIKGPSAMRASGRESGKSPLPFRVQSIIISVVQNVN
jgi:hypothetical protein